MSLVDLAHGNVRELNEFTGCTDLQGSLARLTNWGVKRIVVHIGKDGAGYYESGQWVVVPSVPAAHAVNATGCGDVLSVCMMLLDEHPDPEAKLRLASRIVTEFIEGRRVLIPPLH